MHLAQTSFFKIMDNIPDGIYIVDNDRRIVYWNAAAETISGFTSGEVLGIACMGNILCHVDGQGATLCNGDCPLVLPPEDVTSQDRELYLHHKDGHRVPVSVRTAVLRDEGGSVTGGVMIFTDISRQTDHDLKLKEMEKLALLDGLTHLANRSYLERELEARLEERSRYEVPFGVMFMDIDDFKHVNDRYGHETGDRVLAFVAKTLHGNTRPFDLYGRWGGEEFVGIVHNVTSADLRQLAQRLRKLVEKSFILVEGEKLQVTVSIGATLAKDGDCTATVIQRADTLMYRSKAAGKNRLTMG